MRIAGPLAVFALYFQRGPQGPLILSRLGCWPRCAEQMQQMAQLDNDRMTEVTKDLRDTQARLLEVIPRLSNAKAVLGRMDIRSPYSGEVVGLNVFSMGGVINRGDKLFDVVPEQDSLIIEAQTTSTTSATSTRTCGPTFTSPPTRPASPRSFAASWSRYRPIG